MQLRMRSWVFLICLVALVVCVRCTMPVTSLKTAERLETAAPPMERFLQYFAYVRSLSVGALYREHARQDLVFTEHPSAENRVRLALLLSLPATEFTNRPYALELLQQYLQHPAPPDTGFVDIAAFLVTFIQDTPSEPVEDPRIEQLQTQVHEKELQLASKQQRVKKLQEDLEAQRALHNNLHRQLQEALSEKERFLLVQQQLNKKLQEERRNVKKLQDKIEKIKDIEKSLMDRERPDNKGT